MPPLRSGASFASSAMPASEPITPADSIGIITNFWFGASASALNASMALLRHEVVDRLHVAAGDRVRDHPRRVRLGLGGRSARLGLAERGFLLAFRRRDGRLLLALGGLGLARASASRDVGALLALRLPSPAIQIGARSRGGWDIRSAIRL